MIQFIYISTIARSVVARSADLGADILTVSRRNNLQVGVSGILLQRGRRFLQALEGEPDAVNATVARIRADPRHIAIVALSERVVAERAFGDWAMASDREMAGDAVIARIDHLTRNAAPNVRAQFMSYAAMDVAA
jgi:hypothetical protein